MNNSKKNESKNKNQRKAMIEWGYKQLLSLGYTIKNNNPEMVKDTPWSYVARVETSDGYIYLKHTPELIALEATIIKILLEEFHASVPTVIAHDKNLNCFLMKDAGHPLREILKQKLDVSLICKVITQFTSTQLAVADRVNLLIDIGVPDWRLDKLPDLYNHLLSQKDILIADGLSEDQINALKKMTPRVSTLCNKLAGYSIKETFVQPDFNDNNTLIDNISKKITIIDLGEIVISHPFFSLFNFLHQMKKHHGLTDMDEVHWQIMDSCFKSYLIADYKIDLLDAFKTAHTLWGVYGALAGHRLMMACGFEKLISFQQGTISNSLKEFMAIKVGSHE